MCQILNQIQFQTGIEPTNYKIGSRKRNKVFLDFSDTNQCMAVYQYLVTQSNSNITKVLYNEHYNDWICLNCDHRNFPSRKSCHACDQEIPLNAPFVLTDRNTTPTRDLCIRYIPPSATEWDLHEALLSRCSTMTQIQKIVIARNKKKRKSLMYGFVTFETIPDACKTYENVLKKGLYLNNQLLSVTFAKEIEENATEDEEKDAIPTSEAHVKYYRKNENQLYMDGHPYYEYDTKTRYFVNPYIKMMYDKEKEYYYDQIKEEWTFYDNNTKTFKSIQHANNELQNMLKTIDDSSKQQSDSFGFSDDDDEEEEEEKINEITTNEPLNAVRNIYNENNEQKSNIKTQQQKKQIQQILKIEKQTTVTEESIRKRKRAALELYEQLTLPQASKKQKLAHAKPLNESHFGYKMLTKLGWKSGTALAQGGKTEPLKIIANTKMQGIGFGGSKKIKLKHLINENDSYQEATQKLIAARYEESTKKQ